MIPPKSSFIILSNNSSNTLPSSGHLCVKKVCQKHHKKCYPKLAIVEPYPTFPSNKPLLFPISRLPYIAFMMFRPMVMRGLPNSKGGRLDYPHLFLPNPLTIPRPVTRDIGIIFSGRDAESVDRASTCE